MYSSNRDCHSAFIENVRQVVDPNPHPPGLNQQSIVIQTPNRDIKITAPTRERHKLWFDVSQYSCIEIAFVNSLISLHLERPSTIS